jgi:hypothetical protein
MCASRITIFPLAMLLIALLTGACSRYHTYQDSGRARARTHRHDSGPLSHDASVSLRDAAEDPRDAAQQARDARDSETTPADAGTPSVMPSRDTAMASPDSSRVTAKDVDALAAFGPVQDCRAPGFVPPTSHTRWLAFRGAQQFADSPSVYVVQVGDHGPGKAYEMGANFAVDPWTIGEWSDDGRYFGFVKSAPTNAQTMQGSAIVDTQNAAGPESWQVPGSGIFYHWAPGRSLFALADSDGIHFMDAADHSRDTLIAAAPAGYYRLAWSADGRCGAIAAGGRLKVVDLNAANLAQLAYETASVGSPQWSPRKNRLIFLGSGDSSNELMWLDLDAPNPKPVMLAQAETNNGDAELITRWLDADRVLIWAPNHVMQIVDVGAKPPAIENLGTFGDQFQFVPGNRCLVYSGACMPSGRFATCVMSLDRNASRTPRPVFPSQDFSMVTSAAGSPILFKGELLVELALDGGAYSPHYVRQPGDEPNFMFYSQNPSLSAAPSVPWVQFMASLSGVSVTHSYFWNHSIARLVDDVANGDLSFEELGLFSPDGRDYAAVARDPVALSPQKVPLVILRPHADAPTEQWQLELFATAGFAEFNMAWAP